MDLIFILAKITHITAAIFFIGVVGFRTFIFPVLKKQMDKATYLNTQKAIGLRARGIIKINNIFLILSGVYLLSYHLDVVNPLVHIKATLGLILALLFYIVPLIMQRYKHISWFNTAFHHLFFLLMIITVILSQILYL